MPSRLCAALLCALIGASTYAQEKDDAVVVSGLRDPVDKSYRRMLAGVERFEKRRHLAPDAALRFKLLPRRRDTRMQDIEVAIVADSFEIPLEVAPDHTFTLPRNRAALKEKASVRPNRKKQTMTWRAEIRTPGLPAHTRRLGDLRLECEVGLEAGLISNARPSFFGRMGELLPDGPQYCERMDPRYLFFADRPLFSVALASGARKEVVSVDRLYASATRDPQWKAELAYCDCEVLLDRTYFLPLGDRSWPDDTLVEFEYMDERSVPAHAAQDALVIDRSSKADVRAALGEPVAVDFDSGYSVWVYRAPRDEKKPPPPWREFVLLFAPSGVLAKTRLR